MLTNTTKPNDPLADLVNSEFGKQHDATDPFAELLAKAGNEQDMRLANDLSIEEIKRRTQIDLRKIHCSKTGQPIAELNSGEIDNLIKFHGVKQLEELAPQLDLATGISRIWVHTGPDQLNRLQATDPRGFFCYCIGLALQNHHMIYSSKGTKQFKTVDGQRAFRNSLVKAWYMTGELAPDDLAKANINLRFFMFLDLHNQRFYKMPWHFIRMPGEVFAKALIHYSNNKYLPVGRQGNAGTMVNVEWTKRQLDTAGLAKQEELYTTNMMITGQDRVLRSVAIDLEKFPLLPEEFATVRGVDWIKTVLERFLRNLKTRMDYNSIAYAHLHTAQAFRSGKAFKGDLAEYEYMLDMIGPVEKSMSLRDLVARSKRILGKTEKQQVHVATGPIDLKLTLTGDGTLTTEDEEILSQPEQEQAEKPITKYVPQAGTIRIPVVFPKK